MKKQDTMTAIATMAVVKSADTKVITYGVASETFPVNDVGGTVSIDCAFLSGTSTFRLKHISTCLELAGKDDNAANRQWFNHSVRDPYHKALKFLNRQFMANGKPVSIGLSRRTSKRKVDEGDVTVTAKFGYECVIKAPKKIGEKLVNAAEKAKSESRKRGQRQARKGLANIGEAIAKVEQTLNSLPTPAETTPVELVTSK